MFMDIWKFYRLGQMFYLVVHRRTDAQNLPELRASKHQVLMSLHPQGYGRGVRTTLTLDDDVAMLLKKRAQESGRPFRDVVNQVLRRGLIEETGPVERPIPQPRAMGGSRFDLTQALSMADELGDPVTSQLGGMRRDRS